MLDFQNLILYLRNIKIPILWDNNIQKYQIEKIINSSSSTSIINLMSLSSNIAISSSIPKKNNIFKIVN